MHMHTTHINDLGVTVLGAVPVGDDNNKFILCNLHDVQHVPAPDGLRKDAPKDSVFRSIDVNAKPLLMKKKTNLQAT